MPHRKPEHESETQTTERGARQWIQRHWATALIALLSGGGIGSGVEKLIPRRIEAPGLEADIIAVRDKLAAIENIGKHTSERLIVVETKVEMLLRERGLGEATWPTNGTGLARGR